MLFLEPEPKVPLSMLPHISSLLWITTTGRIEREYRRILMTFILGKKKKTKSKLKYTKEIKRILAVSHFYRFLSVSFVLPFSPRCSRLVYRYIFKNIATI